MDVTLVRDLGALASLRDDWQGLLERCRPNYVFMTWPWLSTWWRYFGRGREPFVLVLRDGRELAGIVPLALATERGPRSLRVRYLHFMGYRPGKRMTDYMDVVAVRKREVLEAAFAYLRGCQHLWDIIDLWDILEDSETLEALRVAAASAGFGFARNPTERALYVRTDGTWDSYYKTHVRDRREFERRTRRLREKGTLEETAPEPAARQAFVDVLIGFYGRRWQEPEDALARYRGFYAELLETVPQDWLACSTLRLDGRAIAAQISLRHASRLYHLATAYDDAFGEFSPGRIQLRNLLETCFLDAAVSACYFGRGNERYKYEWATDEVWACRAHVTNAHMAGSLGVVLRRLPPGLRRPLISARNAITAARSRQARTDSKNSI